MPEVARTMLAYGVRHLPVVVADEVLGMVWARNLLDVESATRLADLASSWGSVPAAEAG